jgi:eukaryotic-like serine/threonine-protein kinase
MFPTLKNYSIIREIGSGGMSVVYEATDRRLHRTIALKMLHPHLCREDGATTRFRREALAAARMDHPHVVRIYEYFTELDAHFIAMEYVPGTDMDSVLDKKGKLPIEPVVVVMGEIALALSEAHGRGIIHRDIKPANILIHRQGRAMLSDFGLAYHNLDKRLTVDNAAAGTPIFMSPEQISGNEIGPASDVYSWGVTFYTLLTGKYPYASQRFPDIVPEIQQARVSFADETVASLPASYYDLLKRCLVALPSDRIQSGMELKKAVTLCRQKHPMEFDTSTLIDTAGHHRKEPSSDLSKLSSKTSVFIPKARVRRTRILLLNGILAVLAAITVITIIVSRRPLREAATPLPVKIVDTMPPPRHDTIVLRKDTAPLPVIRQPAHPVTPRNPLTNTVHRTAAAPAAVSDSGGLFVFCQPWATVYINDKELGNTPFEKPVTLPTGDYKLRLVNKYCAPREETIHIVSGKVVRKRYDLQLLKQ